MSLATLLLVGAAGCDRAAPDTEGGAEPQVVQPAPLTVALEAKGLVFRYVDSESGQVATATTVDAIPTASRVQVVVFDPERPTPPGWEHVADLSAGVAVTTTPTPGFVLQPARPASTVVSASPPPATSRRARAGAHEVVLFSTQGCGYCRKARKWFDKEKIPYSEYDIERDAKAPARLAQLAQAANVRQDQLGGVPVIFVDGSPVLGWDQGRVKQLLGR